MLIDQNVKTDIVEQAGEAHSLRSPIRPVFLHCGWRTRGTWIWSRFRTIHGVYALYEPLSDILASLRTDTLHAFNPGAWKSGHDCLVAPYFAEFQPLLKRGRPGVERYDREFAISHFFCQADFPMPALERYLRLLVRTAQERAGQPVLKFCRSTGRIGWMQRLFPEAVHVAVVRNPLKQFESARRQFVLHGNAFFLATPLLILAMNQDLPVVRSCIQYLDVELADLAGCLCTEHGLASCEVRLRRSNPDEWYRAFLAFWLLTAISVPGSIDHIIDSEMLATVDRYRQECESKLANLTGWEISFADFDRVEQPTGDIRSRLECSDILAAHRAAEAFLNNLLGRGLYNDPTHSWIYRLLTEATLRALMAYDVTPWIRVQPDAAAGNELAEMTGRALLAEEELAAVLASRTWRWTAPLRRLRQWSTPNPHCHYERT